MNETTPSIAIRTSKQRITQTDIEQLFEVIVDEARRDIAAALEHADNPRRSPRPTDPRVAAVASAADGLPTRTRKALLAGRGALTDRRLRMPRRLTNLAALADVGRGPAATQPHTQLRLRLRHIECVQDTREPGKDEILVGGQSTMLTVSPDGLLGEPLDAGAVAPIALGKFKSGDERDLDLVVGRFSLNGAAPYPRIFNTTLVMIEKDLGDPAKLVKLLESIQAVLEQKLIDKVQSFLEGLDGDDKFGAVIGLVVTLLPVAISALIGAVGKLVGDEVFRPFAAALSMQSPDALFPGGKTDSADDVAQFADFGGTYRVGYDFALA